LVEEFPCKDKNEACKREREIFEELDAKMNMLRPYRTQEELKQYNKKYRQAHKQQFKQYKEEHKEELKEYKKQHYQEHKQQFKQYYQDHKQELKEYDKKYREKNRKEINKKIECEFCKKILSKCSMYRHHTICKSKPVKND